MPPKPAPEPPIRRILSHNNLRQNGSGNGHAASVVSDDVEAAPSVPAVPRPISRRLSTYTNTDDGGMDLEDETAGSARR